MNEWVIVSSDDDYRQAAAHFRSYGEWLGEDLFFQNFQQEMDDLQTTYHPQKGGIILYKENGQTIGSIALKQLDGGFGEVKRMYVLPQAQGRNIGRQLLERIIDLSKEKGYHTLRLDSLPRLAAAIHLYKKYGFQEIAPYYHNPIEGVVFMEKKL